VFGLVWFGLVFLVWFGFGWGCSMGGMEDGGGCRMERGMWLVKAGWGWCLS